MIVLYNTLMVLKIASTVAFELCYINVPTKASINYFNLFIVKVFWKHILYFNQPINQSINNQMLSFWVHLIGVHERYPRLMVSWSLLYIKIVFSKIVKVNCICTLFAHQHSNFFKRNSTRFHQKKYTKQCIK